MQRERRIGRSEPCAVGASRYAMIWALNV
jgi:hypothetical protein